MDDGVTVGNVVVIFVGIEEEIGRVHDPYAVFSGEGAGGDVQAVEEDCGFIEGAVAGGVLVNCDSVCAFVAMGRGERSFVELGSDVAVVFDNFQALGEGVLDVLGDPHSALRVEVDIEGLTDGGLSGDEIDGVSGAEFEMLEGFICRKRLGVLGLGVEGVEGGVEAFGIFNGVGDISGVGNMRDNEEEGEKRRDGFGGFHPECSGSDRDRLTSGGEFSTMDVHFHFTRRI